MLFRVRGSIVFFNSPTDSAERKVAPGTPIRLAPGEAGSIVRGDNLAVRFEVTDGNRAVG